MNRLFFRILLIILLPASVMAQEVISGLQVNVRVKNAAKDSPSAREAVQPMLLPFFEDFSEQRTFPNPLRWADSDAFINQDYPVNPPSVGVATLDAIDNLGRLYSNASPFPFMADFLTSQPIRLDSLFTPQARKITRADSLYLSFYYQPQGNGHDPLPQDSLVLEFLAPGETQEYYLTRDTLINGQLVTLTDTIVIEGWRKAWSAPGQPLSTFYAEQNKWFRQVLVPIQDSAMFYTSEFRFRFRNYASLASGILPDWQSNGDQWNIDYIYLNTGRNKYDTLHNDLTFVSKAPRMLKRYTSMPYNQFRVNQVNEKADSLSLKISNLSDGNYNASYSYEVSKGYQSPFHFYFSGNYFVPPFVTSGYMSEQSFARPPVNFVFPVGTEEKIFFTTTHILSNEANIGRRQNDTIKNVTLFANYLSYDDGTAEAGYGLSPNGAQFAYKFKLNRPDSLLAVQMYFNQTITGGNVKSFYLNVWNDFFGEPGEIIYSKFGYEPVFEDSLNMFTTYKLDSTIKIEPGRFPNLIFYVGWRQTTSDNLNIGFDFNNDASENSFYRTFGGWSQSLYKGAVMMRPVLGKMKVVGLQENIAGKAINIYPNPCNTGNIAIELPENTSDTGLVLQISSSNGQMVSSMPYTRDADVSHLNPGFYIVKVLSREGVIRGYSKLIINR